MHNNSKVAVTLFSFRRPELTRQALLNLLANTESLPIYVSVDGEASWSTIKDLEQRRSTIAVVEKIASVESRVRPVVWDKGEGLTAHAIRIMDVVFDQFDIVVSLEEDNLIGRAGLQFLLKAVTGGEQNVLATAFSSYTHPPSTLNYRLTAFPEQWATSFNRSQYMAFRRQALSPNIRPEVIRAAVSKSLDSRVLVEGAVKYWHRLLSEAVLSHSHGDALMQYVAWEAGQLIRAPLQPLVDDLSYFHADGLHPRLSPPEAPKSHDLHPIITEGGTVCRTCDRKDLRARAEVWMRNRFKVASVR